MIKKGSTAQQFVKNMWGPSLFLCRLFRYQSSVTTLNGRVVSRHKFTRYGIPAVHRIPRQQKKHLPAIFCALRAVLHCPSLPFVSPSLLNGELNLSHFAQKISRLSLKDNLKREDSHSLCFINVENERHFPHFLRNELREKKVEKVAELWEKHSASSFKTKQRKESF